MTETKEEGHSAAEDPKKNSKYPESKPKWKRRFRILIGLLIIALLSSTFMLEYVRPNEFGLKVVRIGINRGVQKKVYSPGLNFVIPFGLQEMHRLPKDIQVLELTNYPSISAVSATREKAAHIQTSDGFYVDVDVSILYRIVDPYKVFTTLGPGNSYEVNGIIPRAENSLKATLGKLTTEEFYNSPLRAQKAEDAKLLLNEGLEPNGIKVDHVLVRYFKYSEEIQKNIEEKKLKDQLVFKNQAEARAAAEEAKLKKIIQEGEAAVIVELEKGKSYATQKRAEKDLYVRTKGAEADLQVQLAESEKVRLKNEALQGIGADRMVGVKMAEVYKGIDTLILPSDGPTGVNPLNLENALELFGIRKGGAK